MIEVKNLSHGFLDKELYKDVSFTIGENEHIALIGSNGTGKTTLVEMLLHPEEYTYDGRIDKPKGLRIGYVTQFAAQDKNKDTKVYDFLVENLVKNQTRTTELCEKMATGENLEAIFEEYQNCLDEYEAMDGDHYEANLRKELKLAGLTNKEHLEIGKLSGGEYKLLQIIKEILRRPGLLIMDEPDVFLDFVNLKALRDLINYYKGTLLVITHNRYLLNHCFNKILHLEDMDIQEFDGNYLNYNLALLEQKVELQEQAKKDREEIERNEKIIEKLRGNANLDADASRGRALRARVSYLERLEARKIKAPFVEIRKPEIVFPQLPELQEEENFEPLLSVKDYSLSFEKLLLENVSFDIMPGEKVAIVGPNGTGKTTLLRDIQKRAHEGIHLSKDASLGILSQFHEEVLKEENTIYEEFFELGFETKSEIAQYLQKYYFKEEALDKKICVLSGGEKNLLQLAKLSLGNSNLLILDEPTSHLDMYSQIALEEAVAAYKGAVLMVSHDFYVIANTADYVLFVDENTVRKMRIRTFRKQIYDSHFSKTYLELEQRKKELEERIEKSLQAYDFEGARILCEELEDYVNRMSQ